MEDFLAAVNLWSGSFSIFMLLPNLLQKPQTPEKWSLWRIFLCIYLFVHDPNVLFQPLLMKILKHIWRVLSTHSGPYQGLNIITTDCQNCLNNFHFQLSLSQHNYLQKRDYKSMAASLSLVTLVSPCQWMAATASILAKISSAWRKRNWAPPS